MAPSHHHRHRGRHRPLNRSLQSQDFPIGISECQYSHHSSGYRLKWNNSAIHLVGKTLNPGIHPRKHAHALS